MKRSVFLAAGALLVALASASCRVDAFGLVWSASTPDDRFTASRGEPDPAWTGAAPVAPFSFVFITDTHIVNGDTSRLDKLGPAMAAAGDRFVLLGGDLTQDGRAEDFAALGRWQAAVGVPSFPAVGNHDLYFSGWDNLRPALKTTSYSFAVGPRLRVVVLDSANATLGAAQFAWLRATLEAAAEPDIVLVTHIPFFDTGFSEINWSDPAESAALLRLCEREGVRLVLFGHTHHAAERILGPTAYVVGESARVQDGARKAIRVTETGTGLSWATFDLP